MLSRDIRLTAEQLCYARDACKRRRHELEKRLERNSYDGKHGMKDRVETELAEMIELERVFEHNRAACAREFAELLNLK